MRVIAGSARRRTLEVAADSSTRPFLEIARGALFNSLGEQVVGARVLDLYAGSGALGIEALSRGAAACVFVERDPRAAAALERNLQACGFAGLARTRRADADAVLAELAGREEEFDLVFVDPPFAELANWKPGGSAGEAMRHAARVLAGEGRLVLRLEDGRDGHGGDCGHDGPPEWPGLELSDERRYGRSRVIRYRRRREGDNT